MEVFRHSTHDIFYILCRLDTISDDVDLRAKLMRARDSRSTEDVYVGIDIMSLRLTGEIPEGHDFTVNDGASDT